MSESGRPLTRLPDQEAVAEAVLAILLERHPALLAAEEVAAELSDPDMPMSPVVIGDAIDELRRLGLAHCLGERFVFASHRAVRARQLGV